MKMDRGNSEFLSRMHVWEKRLMYIVFISAFLGPSFFTIDFNIFTLFPFRFFLVLLLCLFSLRAFIERKNIFRQETIQWYLNFLYFWLGYSVLSLSWALSRADAIRNIFLLLLGISIIFLSTHYFCEQKDMQNLFFLWLFIFTILLLVGLWEHLTGNHLPVSKLNGEFERWYIRSRPTGIFHNPNDYATFLAFSIPFSLAVFKYMNQKYLRLCGLTGAISAFYFIVITNSRVNVIVALLETLWMLIFTVSNENSKIKLDKKMLRIVMTCFIAIIIFITVEGNLQKFYVNTKNELSSLVQDNHIVQGSTMTRLNLFKNGLTFLVLSAGFGVGAGNAGYYLKYFSRYPTAGFVNLHNWWLEIVVNYGILVLLGYFLFYFYIIRTLWQIYHNQCSKSERMICEALFVSLVGFSFASMSPSSIMSFNPQWLLFAFALCFINILNRKKGIKNHESINNIPYVSIKF